MTLAPWLVIAGLVFGLGAAAGVAAEESKADEENKADEVETRGGPRRPMPGAQMRAPSGSRPVSPFTGSSERPPGPEPARPRDLRRDVPARNDAVGGGAVSGSLPGAGGSPIQRHPTATRPLPGNPYLPNQGDKPATAGRDDHGKDKQLEGLVNDPRSQSLLDQAAGKDAAAPGRASGNELIDRMRTAPSADQFKNSSTRQEQQSEGNETTYKGIKGTIDKDGNFHATKRDQDGLEAERAWRQGQSDYRAGPPTPAEPSTVGKINQFLHDIGVSNDDKFKTCGGGGGTCTGAVGVRGTPNPMDDKGDGHAPKVIETLGTPKKTPEQVEAERRRQVTLPGEAGQRHDPIRPDPKDTTPAATVQGSGRIDPGPDAATSTGHATQILGTPAVKTPVGLGAVDGRFGARPGGGPEPHGPSGGPTPDNPTAASDSGGKTTSSGSEDPGKRPPR